MNFHILTLFPEMVTGGLNTSITGRATVSYTHLLGRWSIFIMISTQVEPIIMIFLFKESAWLFELLLGSVGKWMDAAD